MREGYRRRTVVVGAGISGLATAVFCKNKAPEDDLVLLNDTASLGGVTSTSHIDALAIENGPIGLPADDPVIHALLDLLQLRAALQPESRSAHRCIYAEGTLRRLRFTPEAMVREGLLSRRAVLRALAEPTIRSVSPPNEAVWDFFARRFGPAVAERLVQPLILGVTTGEARDTEMRALFPSFVDLERNYGSVTWGLLRGRLGTKSPKTRGGYWLKPGGLSMIADAVAARPDIDVRTGHRVVDVAGMPPDARASSDVLHPKLRVRIAANGAGEPERFLDATNVVLATPTYASADIVRSLLPDAASLLQAIPYHGMAVVHLVYRKRDLSNIPEGLQFLVRRGQGIRMLGCQWSSSMFPGQAPEDVAVLRCLFGGEFDRAATTLTKDALIRTTRVELASMLGLESIPLAEHVVLWPKAVPHFRPGHSQQVVALEAALRTVPGLHVIGSGVRGIAVRDCVHAAHETARRIAST